MSDSIHPFERGFQEAARLLEQAAADTQIQQMLETVAGLVVNCLRNRGTLFTCGNGGSAAMATHFSAELVGPFLDRSRRPYASIPLGFDPSALTAIANDYDYETALARQLRALGKPGDVLWALSTSGNSGNVLTALEAARSLGVKTVLFTNHSGGRGKALADYVLHTPECSTPRVQELHLLYGHGLCEAIEARMALVDREAAAARKRAG